MKKNLILFLFILFILSMPAKLVHAQLTQATGDDFTIAVFNDIHAENDSVAWQNSIDWLVGVNGRGPAVGQSAKNYWNIKAISGVGDYVTVCNPADWSVFLAGWNRISALGLPGIWPVGNHDGCGSYTTTFGSTLQSSTFDVSTLLGTVRLGFVGVGIADDMASGQPSRTFVDAAIAASQSNRQWFFIRHVGTYEFYPGGIQYSYPANGDSGWCIDVTQCAGSYNTGVQLRDAFYKHEAQVYWGIHGHNGYTANNNLVADNGHTVNVTGNLGASGGLPGWITLFKFRPSHNDIQWAVYKAYDNSVVSGPYTWAWTPQFSFSSGLFPMPSPIVRIAGVSPP